MAAPGNGVRGQAGKTAPAGRAALPQPVKEFVHPVAAQGDAPADWHALANLEIRDRFLGASHDRFLPGNLAELNDRNVEQLDVLAGFTHADVDGHLSDSWNRHRILPPKVFHQCGNHFVAIAFLHSALHFPSLFSVTWRFLRAQAFQRNPPESSYFSSVLPQRRQTRSLLPSGKTLWPIRA